MLRGWFLQRCNFRPTLDKMFVVTLVKLSREYTLSKSWTCSFPSCSLLCKKAANKNRPFWNWLLRKVDKARVFRTIDILESQNLKRLALYYSLTLGLCTKTKCSATDQFCAIVHVDFFWGGRVGRRNKFTCKQKNLIILFLWYADIIKKKMLNPLNTALGDKD